MERERALQRERIELSQAIHDTTAQSAYLIGLGIDAAKQVAGDSNEELTARLEATSRLSKGNYIPNYPQRLGTGRAVRYNRVC